MIVWHKNKLRNKQNNLKFDSEILQAGKFLKWLVVATKSKLYFLGDDECAIPFNILDIDIHDNYILYHNSIDMNVYMLLHPYEMEERLFKSPFYILRFSFSANVLILENDKRYVIKNRDDFYSINLHNANDGIKYDIDKIDFYQFSDVINNSLDTKMTNLNVNMKYRLHVYNNTIVLLFKNTVTFVTYFEQAFCVTKTINLDRYVNVVRNIRFNLVHKCIYFLQLNDTLVYDDEIVCRFDGNKYINALQEQVKSIHYKYFWKKASKFEKRIMSVLDTSEILQIVKDCVINGQYIFNITGNIQDLDYILEDEYHKSKNAKSFDAKLEKYNFSPQELLSVQRFFGCIEDQRSNSYKDSETIINDRNTFCYDTESINETTSTCSGFYLGYLRSTKSTPNLCPVSNCKNDMAQLLNIEYTRLFTYNEKFANMKKPSCNLAYKIIYYEKNRDKLFKFCKKCNYQKLFKYLYSDRRIEEVVNLFIENKWVFELDDNDIEDKSERHYILRMSSIVGMSYCFYNNKLHIDKLRNAFNNDTQMSYPIVKNGKIENIEIRNEYWNNWPSFNLGCLSVLTTSKTIKLEIVFKNDRKQDLYNAGVLYALGLKNKLQNANFNNLKGMIGEGRNKLVMGLMLGYGISNKNIRNLDFENYCYDIINDDNPIQVKLGALCGLAYNFRNMKNTKLKNVIISEINKNGIYASENYNRNNMIWYDKTYKVINTFNLAKSLGQTTEYIVLENKLCELLINGICLKDVYKYKIRLTRTKKSQLDEVFYYGYFCEKMDCINICLQQSKDLEETCDRLDIILDEIKANFFNLDVWDIYNYAGSILYHSFRYKKVIQEKHISLLVFIEREMATNKHYKTLFDYLLITYCIIASSTCNLDLIRILRRLLKSTEKPKNTTSKTYYSFTHVGISSDIVDTYTFGDIEKYKICLGILTLGLSKYYIENTKDTEISILCTFYVNWPMCTYDQDFYNIFRYELLGLVSKTVNKDYKKYHIQKYFKDEIKKLGSRDIKYVLDVLSDYYESYHGHQDYLIDIKRLKDLVIRST